MKYPMSNVTQHPLTAFVDQAPEHIHQDPGFRQLRSQIHQTRKADSDVLAKHVLCCAFGPAVAKAFRAVMRGEQTEGVALCG